MSTERLINKRRTIMNTVNFNNKVITSSSSKLLFIKNAILLVISFLLLISAFLPIYSIRSEFKYCNTHDIRVKFSAVDSILFFFDFLKIENTDFIDKKSNECYELLMDDFSDTYDKLSVEERENYELTAKQERLAAKYTYYSIRSLARRSGKDLTYAARISSFVSSIYVLASILTFVLAWFNFVPTYRKKRSLFDKTWRCAINLPILAILTYYTIGSYGAIFRNYGFVNRSSSIAPIKESFAIGVALSIAAIVCLVVYLCIERIRNDGGFAKSDLIKPAISIILSFVIVITMFMPLVNTCVKTRFVNTYSEERTAVINVDTNYFSNIDSNRESKFNILKFQSYTWSQVSQGEADGLNEGILTEIISEGMDENAQALFSLIYYLELLLGLFALLLVKQTSLYLITGKNRKVRMAITKFLCILLSIAIISLIIIFMISVNSVVKEWYHTNTYKVVLSLTPFISLIASISLFFVPLRKRYR